MLRKEKRIVATPPAPLSVCTQTLDDSGAVAGAFGFGHLPTVAPQHQEYAYELTGASAPATLSALPAAPAGYFIAQAGVIAYGLQCLLGPGNTHGAGWGLRIAWGALPAMAGSKNLTFAYSGADLTVTDGTTTVNLGAVNGAGVTMGVYVDATTGQVGWTANGVDQGALAGAVLSPGQTFFVWPYVEDGAGAAVGKVVAGRFVTWAHDLSGYGFPAGATDKCGNVIA